MMMQQQEVELVKVNPDKIRFDYDVIRMTLEATRSVGCIAPFIVDTPTASKVKKGAKIKVKTKWGPDSYVVEHGNFAKVHCWVDAVDPVGKGIKCDGINIVGKPLKYGMKFGSMGNSEWNNPKSRVTKLMATCTNAILGTTDPDEGISDIRAVRR